MMLDGLMSRCTTPHASAAASARAACSITSSARASGIGPSRRTSRFERLAFDQFHDVETLTVLFTVLSDARDIRMMNLRGRARFAQETRSDSGIFRDFSVDDFKRDRRNSIPYRARDKLSPSLRRRARPENRPRQLQLRSDRTSVVQASIAGVFRIVWFLTAAQKTQTNETTKASTILREWSSADRARAYGWVAFHTGKCEGLI